MAHASLGIGTATFLDGYGFENAGRPGVPLLREAIESGLRYIDTAAAYGQSERAIGDVSSLIREKRVRVCTKIGVSDLRAGGVEAATRASLERLSMPAVDTLMLHSITESDLRSRAIDEAWSAVRQRALASRFGASTYGAEDAAVALDASWCSAVQVEYSIVNQSVVRAVVPKKRAGQEIVVRSVLCKGLLAGSELPVPPRVSSAIKGIGELATTYGMSLPALAIRFALDTPGVDVVLVGVASRHDLHEALMAAALPPLSPEQFGAAAAFDFSDEEWTHPEKWKDGRIS